MRCFFLSCTTLLSLSCFADPSPSDQNCPRGKKHYRTTFRHIEKGGIGYEEGYTTLEVFLSSDPSQWKVTPFFDARGHLFDHGKWAANAGAGLRALWGNRVYGINTYYDYRNTGRIHSNQVGIGLETLGELFDFRINGYLPVGLKLSSPYGTTFDTFSGHSMLLSQKYHSAMKGADAEFGFHLGHSEGFDFYAGAGPYYFIGEIAPATWGGKARLFGTFKDILTLELSDSYDRTFHNKFQGQISFSFSFGPKSKVKEQKRSCNVANVLNTRMLQPVGRQEIIVVDKPRRNNVAIDPITGVPYFFVFVDNTSSSDGTYESPYHTLAQAEANSSPNDIIYVFPGDGTTRGMDSGITLKANQRFWGSGISHWIPTSAGPILIPAQSSTHPTITNTNFDTLGDAVTLATHNNISGFTITSALHDAIYGADPQSLEVSSCTFENTTTFPIEASFSSNASISVTNNQFLNNGNGIALTLNGPSTVVCSNNTFKGQTSTSEAPIEISAIGNTFTTHIENNLFDANQTGSVLFNLQNVVDANIRLLNNTITNNRTGAKDVLGSSFVMISSGTIAACSLVAEGNTFSGNTSNALYLHTEGEITTLDITASTNSVSLIGGAALVVATPTTNTLTLLATDNTLNQCGNNGIAVIASGVTTTGNITINNNTLTAIGNVSNGVAVNQGFSNLDLTILNNTIQQCEGTGILSYASAGIGSLTLNISNNAISNCQNLSSNAAGGIDIEQFTSFSGTVANNTLSDNTSTAVAIGSTQANPTVCLTLSGNQNSNTYLLSTPDPGVFHLSPCDVNSVNTGTINLSGTITPVQSCPSATPCPP